MQENGSKQNLLSPGNEVSENTPWEKLDREMVSSLLISAKIQKRRLNGKIELKEDSIFASGLGFLGVHSPSDHNYRPHTVV